MFILVLGYTYRCGGCGDFGCGISNSPVPVYWSGCHQRSVQAAQLAENPHAVLSFRHVTGIKHCVLYLFRIFLAHLALGAHPALHPTQTKEALRGNIACDNTIDI